MKTFINRAALVVALVGAVLLFTNQTAQARPAGEFPLLLLLNGEPQSGTQVTTATGTDITISVSGGKPYVVSCTTDSVMLGGTTVTSSTGQDVYAGSNVYLVPLDGTSSLAFRAKASAGTCKANLLK